MTPKRIQRKRCKGWKMPANTIYVGRPTKWGNPFTIGGHYNVLGTGRPASRYDVIRLFEFKLQFTPMLQWEIKRNLQGKNLACFCKEGEPCHADVLLKIANDL